MHVRIYLAGLLFFVLARSSLLSGAGPLIIQDNRLSALNLSGKLGYGYSEFTNTMNGLCLSTQASQDRGYSFYFYTGHPGEWLKPPSGHASGPVSQALRRFMFLNSRETTETDFESGRIFKLTHQYILLEVNRDWNQVAENSQLASFPDYLLQSKGYLSFFRLCGSSFIGGINRQSWFAMILTWRLTGDQDSVFRNTLVQKIKRLYETDEQDTAFNTNLKKRRLRFLSQTMGSQDNLSPESPVRAVEFAQIRDLVHAQSSGLTAPGSGLPEAIEISFWTDHPRILEAIAQNHRATDIWRIRSVLSQNNRFIQSSDQTDTLFNQEISRAGSCQKIILGALPGDDNPGQIKFEHLGHPGDDSRYLSLEDFRKILLKEKPAEKLETHYQKFLNGPAPAYDDAASGGFLACLNSLKGEAFLLTPFHDLEPCNYANSFELSVAPVIKNYCPPQQVYSR